MGNSKSIMRTQRRKKMIAVERFGGKCCICGYNKCINALEFHHLNKDEKEEKPAYIIMRWSWKRALKELEKCILVCSNCHREIHFNELDISPQKYFKPWIKKKCEYCKKEYETKDKNQKYDTPLCASFANRKVERPSKEQLNELMQTTTWTKMGQMFGVSDNAVRKWAKKYDLLT